MLSTLDNKLMDNVFVVPLVDLYIDVHYLRLGVHFYCCANVKARNLPSFLPVYDQERISSKGSNIRNSAIYYNTIEGKEASRNE